MIKPGPRCVAIAIIDQLKIIQVQHQYREGMPIPQGAFPFLFCQNQEVSTVIEIGQ
jgi:hypothetical protein